jgi:hypothetical protein
MPRNVIPPEGLPPDKRFIRDVLQNAQDEREFGPYASRETIDALRYLESQRREHRWRWRWWRLLSRIGLGPLR